MTFQTGFEEWEILIVAKETPFCPSYLRIWLIPIVLFNFLFLLY